MTLMQYYLYFAGFDGKREQVGVARSPDQINWEISPQPVIPVGEAGAWDERQTSNPCVIYDADAARFRMWYQGVDGGGRYRIGYAESADGWTWEKSPDQWFARAGLADLNPVPRREGFHQPLVFRDGAGYKLYFLDHRAGLGYVRVATSEDGLDWQIHPEDCLAPSRPWESLGLHYPWVNHEEGRYVMWYTSEAEKTRWYLNRAVSADGYQWQRDPDYPVIDIQLPRKVSRFHYFIPRKLLRLYPNYLHPEFRQHYSQRAQLPKGLLGKPLLTLHDVLVYKLRAKRYTNFNNSSVVKQADGAYLMYFQARTENGDLSIGSARSRDGVEWEDVKVDLLRETILKQKIGWCLVFDADPHLLIMNGGA